MKPGELPSREDLERMARKLGTHRASAEFYGISDDQSYRIRTGKRLPPITSVELPNGNLEITGNGYDDIDRFLKAFGLQGRDDPTWELVQWWPNSWPAIVAKGTVRQFHQIKAHLKLRTPANPLAIKRELIEEMKRTAPKPRKVTKRDYKSGLICELSLYDLHIGKLADQEETGNRYDLKAAEDAWHSTLDALASWASNHKLEKIVLPIGNDFLHFDTLCGKTTAGTQMEQIARLFTVYKQGRRLIVEAIETLVALANEVHICTVPGNHDEMATFFLGDYLEVYYSNREDVTIDNTPTHRKYLQHGINLLGWTHGKDEKPGELPLIMAKEKPWEWASSSYQEWHLGHKHEDSMQSYKGVRVRRIPSLGAQDTWHTNKGYVGSRRTGMAFLWHDTDGPAGEYTYNLPLTKIHPGDS